MMVVFGVARSRIISEMFVSVPLSIMIGLWVGVFLVCGVSCVVCVLNLHPLVYRDLSHDT